MPYIKADFPVEADVNNTEPVPIFESPPDPETVPEPLPKLMLDEMPDPEPSDVTARSDTPFNFAFPPTDTVGKYV